MVVGPTVHVSDKVEELIAVLGKELNKAPPFTPHWVLLPRTTLKNSYVQRLLGDNGVVMGVEWKELGQGVQELCHYVDAPAPLLPARFLLTLHIEALLWKKRDKLPPLAGAAKSVCALRSLARQLAVKLADLFLFCYKLDAASLAQWVEKRGWEQALWKEVCERGALAEQLESLSIKEPAGPLTCHVMNFSFLEESYHRFFLRIAHKVNVIYYQWSPCRQFWTDTVSEKGRLAIEQAQAAKGVALRVRKEWSSYLKERNTLLANWGGAVRRTFRLFEDFDLPLVEHYHPVEPTTVLGEVQEAILENKTGEKKELLPDRSLGLFPASAKLREVEILYHNLLALTQDGEVSPGEIRILAPDIAHYWPYIVLVFGEKQAPFRFFCADLPREALSAWLRAVRLFFAVREKRFDVASIEAFLSHPFVRKKFSLKEQEVASFVEAMKRLGVQWGVNRRHRAALLENEPLEKGDGGTWEAGWRRWCELAVRIPKSPWPWKGLFPSFSQVESVGTCMNIVYALCDDLEELATGEKTLSAWKAFLIETLTHYFFLPKEEEGAFSFLLGRFDALDDLDAKLEKELFPGETMIRWIVSLLEEKRGEKRENDLNALFFGSLHEGAAFPAQVTYLLGMEEGAFPRAHVAFLLEGVEKALPSSIEKERALFLELFLGTRRAFYCSYLAVDPSDGKETSPSGLIQELFSYLDGAGEALTVVHPPYPFHKASFSTTSFLRSFSPRYYGVATQFYQAKKSETLPFIPSFFIETLPPTASEFKEVTIDLKELRSFARHPIRFYLNKTFRIYLESSEIDAEFTLSPLSRFFLHRLARESSLETALKEADQWGKLPSGRFKELACARLREEWQERALRAESEVTLRLEKERTQDEQVDEKSWHLPALSLTLEDQTVCHLEGALIGGSFEGFSMQGRQTRAELVKGWPDYLVFCQIKPSPLPSTLLFNKKKSKWHVEEPGKALARFLSYYVQALTFPSPCLPEWVDLVAKGDEKGLERSLARSLDGGTDPYLKWVSAVKGPFSPQVLIQTWGPVMHEVFDSWVVG